MTNDFDAVRAYLDFWGEHPRRDEALAALGRIETALRVFAKIGDHFNLPVVDPADFEPWEGDDEVLVGIVGEGEVDLIVSDFRTAAARFAETAEGEGT